MLPDPERADRMTHRLVAVPSQSLHKERPDKQRPGDQATLQQPAGEQVRLGARGGHDWSSRAGI
jgi:hypothetical protein